MRKIRSTLGWLTVGAGALALAGCGGGYDNGSGSGTQTTSPAATATTPPPAPSAFAVKPLVSNVAGAAVTQDPDLQHGWGIAFAPNNPVWVSGHASNVTTVYDGDGNIKLPTVNIPAGAKAGSVSGPTGAVGNASSSFVVMANGKSGAAQFLFDGTGGTISGWNSNVDIKNAVTLFDGSNNGDVFTGLAIVTGIPRMPSPGWSMRCCGCPMKWRCPKASPLSIGRSGWSGSTWPCAGSAPPTMMRKA